MCIIFKYVKNLHIYVSISIEITTMLYRRYRVKKLYSATTISIYISGIEVFSKGLFL